MIIHGVSRIFAAIQCMSSQPGWCLYTESAVCLRRFSVYRQGLPVLIHGESRLITAIQCISAGNADDNTRSRLVSRCHFVHSESGRDAARKMEGQLCNCPVRRGAEVFRVGRAPKSDQEALCSFGARRRSGWGRPRRATRKHCIPSGCGGVPGGAGPEKRSPVAVVNDVRKMV